MTRDEAIADYFRVHPTIARFIPALLADLWEIGSDPEWTVEVLRAHGIGPESQVLDLGCGKGAAAIAIAEALGARIVGVEFQPAFVEVAQREVVRRGLTEQVTIRCEDIRATVRQAQPYDAVLLLAVGDVLGNLEATVGQLRACVRPGGLIVIDDAYADDAQAIAMAGYDYLRPRNETLRQLTAHGDTLLVEKVWTVDEVREQNRRYMAQIEARAEALAQQHPDLAPHFEAYVAIEWAETHLLESDLACAAWVLRKHDGLPTCHV